MAVSKKRYAFALKRAKKRGAVPKWADRQKMFEIYTRVPRGHTVDHIIPLNHALICGLHIPENLQYLKRAEEEAKGNSFTPLIISKNEIE